MGLQVPGLIIFNGGLSQTFTSGGTISNVVNFTVNSGTTLQMAAATTVISGNGDFTLSSGATLGVTSSAGITTGGAIGNIQVTGTRTYSTGANYIYNGITNQAVGNGLTQNTPANIEINNSGNTVSLVTATNLTGDLTITAGTLDTNGQTVTFSGAGAQVIGGSVASQSFDVIIVNKAGGAVSTAGSISTINAGDFTQTLGDFNAPGTLTLSGNLNLTAGTFTAGASTNIAGNFTSTGTFNNNGGIVTFNGGAAQAIAAETYYDLIMSGAGQKNASGGITVSGDLTNGAVFNLGTNALNVTGTINNTGGELQFSGIANGLAASSGTVTYNGGSQTIATGTYNNLTINQSTGLATLGGSSTVNGTLTLTAGNVNLNSNALTLGSSATAIAGGPFSSAKMIIASGGSEIRKSFSSAGGPFLFPVGENSGTTEYSPVSITVNAGTFGTPYVGVTVVDAKHPDNASATNFLSRYWNIYQLWNYRYINYGNITCLLILMVPRVVLALLRLMDLLTNRPIHG